MLKVLCIRSVCEILEPAGGIDDIHLSLTAMPYTPVWQTITMIFLLVSVKVYSLAES